MGRRALTAEETNVLAIIQQGYGPQNDSDRVFFTESDEAAIFVKASDGTSPMMANSRILQHCAGMGQFRTTTN